MKPDDKIILPDSPDAYDSLLAFAREILAAWPEGGIEGGDLQDIAEKHGLLVPEIRHAPCVENCPCAWSARRRDLLPAGGGRTGC